VNLLYLIYFFKDFEDAKDFYDRHSKRAKVLGEANTVDYGHCYFVSLEFSDSDFARLGEWLGWKEWQDAQKYKSYCGHGSSLSPTDVWGFERVIEEGDSYG